MKSELERTKNALAVAVRVIGSAISQISTAVELIDLGGLAGCMTADLSRISQVLNPPPEMEEVKVVRWEAYRDDGLSLGVFGSEDDAINKLSCHRIVKLTGTYQRPKKQPVELSVSVGAKISGSGISYPIGGKLHPEWESRPECHGKTGALTFTWQE